MDPPTYDNHHQQQQLGAEHPTLQSQQPYDDAFNLAEDDPLLVSQGTEIISAELSPSKTLQKPYEGMVFDNLEAAGEYYAEYGRQHGFWTRICSSYKTKPRSDEVTGRVYVCVRERKHEPTVSEETPSNEKQDVSKKGKRLRSTLKCGCPASLRIILDRYTLKWMVSVFNDDHNHKPVTPCKRMKMKSNKQMPKVVKDLTKAFHRENLRVSKLPSIFGSSNIGFDKRDCYNHLKNVRHRELETGDTQAVLNYFGKNQAACPQFYYSMQCLDAEMIIDHFILARWRKDANKFRGLYSAAPLQDCDNEHADALRLKHMCQESTKLACLAASSKQKYLVFMESLKECSTKMACIEDPVEIHSSILGESSREPKDINPSPLSQLMLLDPNIS